MGTIIGVVVGYALGTRAGDDGWAEFRDAWKVISSSEEVRDMVSAGFSMARDLLGRGSEMLAGALSGPNDGASLRPVA
ncbi:MAG: hypothetical protein WAM97_17470 [Acidimicrobiales bacterium]